MNKLIKICLITGISYVLAELFYRIGQGKMLGILAEDDNYTAEELIKFCKDDKSLRLRIIALIAQLSKEKK